jgi:hypothetical protein
MITTAVACSVLFCNEFCFIYIQTFSRCNLGYFSLLFHFSKSFGFISEKIIFNFLY